MNIYSRLLSSLESISSDLSPSQNAAIPALLGFEQLGQISEHIEYLFYAPEKILDRSELEHFTKLVSSPTSDRRSLRDHTFMIMKATRLCNLRCTYCHSWRDGPNQVMPFSVLSKAIHNVLVAPGVRHVDFVWHGGETTLLPVSFFKKALWLQETFRTPSQTITNSIQTNATRLTDEWIQFLKHNDFKVGVSLDGPKQLHDSRRVSKSGKGTWDAVIAGLNELKAARIDFGVLVVVNKEIVRYGPRALLDLLVELEVKGAALLNVIPDNKTEDDSHDGDYLPWPEFVNYLTDLFSVWWADYREKVTIRELAALTKRFNGSKPVICEFAGNCMGQFLTIDPNGEVSACDKYIGDQKFVFGNLQLESLPHLMASSKNLKIAAQEAESDSRTMKTCKFFEICNGGCPHDIRLSKQLLGQASPSCCGLAELLGAMQTLLGVQIGSAN